MSVQAMTWAFEQDLDPHAKLVLLALANRANHETGLCHPGQELIASECSMSARTVRRHLKALEDAGYVERRARMLPEGRGRTSDEYRLAFYQPDRMAGRSERPTGQIVPTNRTNQDDQPDTGDRGTVREPKENPKSLRRTAMTDDWQPDDDNLSRIRERHPTVDVETELANFRDHWISKGERRADWNAGLRTWMRNAEKWQNKRTGPSDPSFPAGAGGVWT